MWCFIEMKHFHSLIWQKFWVLKKDEQKDNLTVVIVRNGNEEAGLIIDNLVGQHEIVIKPLLMVNI